MCSYELRDLFYTNHMYMITSSNTNRKFHGLRDILNRIPGCKIAEAWNLWYVHVNLVVCDLDHGITGLQDCRFTGLQDYKITRLLDYEKFKTVYKGVG